VSLSQALVLNLRDTGRCFQKRCSWGQDRACALGVLGFWTQWRGRGRTRMMPGYSREKPATIRGNASERHGTSSLTGGAPGDAVRPHQGWRARCSTDAMQADKDPRRALVAW